MHTSTATLRSIAPAVTIPPDGLVVWTLDGAVLRNCRLDGAASSLTGMQPGYYEMLVRFGSADAGPPTETEALMDFVLLLNGQEYGARGRAGDAMIARASLGPASTVGVRNKAGRTVDTGTSPETAWFSLKAI